MSRYPEEVKDALEVLICAATKHGFSFAGVLMSVEAGKPPFVGCCGNVTELSDGMKFAELLRMYVELIESSCARGTVTREKALPPQ